MAGLEKAEVLDRARGQWEKVMSAFVHPDYLNPNKEGPCPVCKGITRFRFDDKFGNGDSYCSHCGNRDGIKLIQEVKGLSFPETLREISNVLHMSVAVDLPAPVPEQRKKKAASKWVKAQLNQMKADSSKVTVGSPVDVYLRNRGISLEAFPGVLRYHPSLDYVDEEKNHLGKFDAMLAIVQDKEGRPVTIHRTYLQDGRKLELVNGQGQPLSAKKVFSAVGKGGAIRLCPGAGKRLAICEGIETGFAVYLLTGLDVWCGISSTIMANVEVPDHVEEVFIFGDHDLPDEKGRCAGQAGSLKLSTRLLAEGKKLVMPVQPPVPGSDWLQFMLDGGVVLPDLHEFWAVQDDGVTPLTYMTTGYLVEHLAPYVMSPAGVAPSA